MVILENDTDVNLVLSKIKLQSPTAIKTEGYGNLYYQCGCGNDHNVNDEKVLKFAAAPIVKLVMLCPKNFYTFIKIKGFFKQTCISEWTCKKKIFEQAIFNLFPEWTDEDKKNFDPHTLFYKK